MAPKRKPAPPEPGTGSVPNLGTGINDKNSTIPEKQDAQETQKAIRFDAAAEPELNPSSPEFNAARYREYLSTLDLSDLEHRLQRAVARANDAAAAAAHEITSGKIIPKALEETATESLAEIMAISEWANQTTAQILTPQLRKLFDAKDTLNSFSWKTFIEGLQEGEKRLKALMPFLTKELPKIHSNAGLEEISIDDLLSYIALDGRTITEPEDGTGIPDPIREALERAIAAAAPATVTARRADIVEYPLDKVNSNIWNLLQDTTGRQLKLKIDTAKGGSEKNINVCYSIDFDELENNGIKITKKLLPYDKRVYIAISALYNAGNSYITLTQIYYAMGNTGKPSTNQLEKINESVTKMRGANIFIDNIQESEAYNYLRFKHTGYLLPAEITTATINGQLAESAIHILREPPVMTFAKQRKQVTTITVKVLQSPISKTDANLLIDDYLIERIGRAKRSGQSCKILYETLYEHAQITTYKQKARAPEKIKTYLDHYKACGMIAAYKMGKDGIQIEF